MKFDVERLTQYMPKGDGYNSEFANDLVQAAQRLDEQEIRISELEKELFEFKNPKNWTRPYDCNGDLLNNHALYLPYV